MNEFSVVHNGIGKCHLINDDLKLICNTKGYFDFRLYRKLIIKDKKYFEKLDNKDEYLTEISYDLVCYEYCKKCLKIVLKN